MSGFRSLNRKIRNIKDDLEDNVADAVESATDETVATAKNNVMSQNTVWRMNLYRSIDNRRVDFGSKQRVVVEAGAKYAGYVEYGTGQRGVATRGVFDPTYLKKSYGTPSLTPSFISDITTWVFTKPFFHGERSVQTANAIATTIAKEGTYASPFMRPAWFATKSVVIDAAERAARNTVRRG